MRRMACTRRRQPSPAWRRPGAVVWGVDGDTMRNCGPGGGLGIGVCGNLFPFSFRTWPRARSDGREQPPRLATGSSGQDEPDLALQHRKALIEDVPDHPVIDAGVAVNQNVAQRDDRRRPVSLAAIVGSRRDSLLTASPMTPSCRSTPERSNGSAR